MCISEQAVYIPLQTTLTLQGGFQQRDFTRKYQQEYLVWVIQLCFIGIKRWRNLTKPNHTFNTIELYLDICFQRLVTVDAFTVEWHKHINYMRVRTKFVKFFVIWINVFKKLIFILIVGKTSHIAVKQKRRGNNKEVLCIVHKRISMFSK